jgi:RecJ-like exonuclease
MGNDEITTCECCGKEFLQSELNEFNLCQKCEAEKQQWLKDMQETYESDLRDV